MTPILHDIFLALWFFCPAGVANVSPIFAAHMPYLKKYTWPIDCGLNFRGRRVLGDHKTWRGLMVGILMAILTLWLQQLLAAHISWLAHATADVGYATLPTVLVGALFGLGALGGDALESFFKRQRGVDPGKGWFPFDQIDYIVGGALATAPFVQLHLAQYIALIVLWLGVHVVASYIGYLLKLKDSPI
jgi:CDP-2,3-bis-(O-geranylgeranyl)-sn-glycerol synthase